MKYFRQIWLILFIASGTFCNAQDNLYESKSDFVVGGSVWGQNKRRDWDVIKERITKIESDILLGYFISNNDLLYCRTGIYYSKEKQRNSINDDQTLKLTAYIAYRRYFNGFFIGPFAGAEKVIWTINTQCDHSESIDGSVGCGVELGYSYNLSTKVLLEIKPFLSYNRILYKREQFEIFYYSRVGITIGLMFLHGSTK